MWFKLFNGVELIEDNHALSMNDQRCIYLSATQGVSIVTTRA